MLSLPMLVKKSFRVMGHGNAWVEHPFPMAKGSQTDRDYLSSVPVDGTWNSGGSLRTRGLLRIINIEKRIRRTCSVRTGVMEGIGRARNVPRGPTLVKAES